MMTSQMLVSVLLLTGRHKYDQVVAYSLLITERIVLSVVCQILFVAVGHLRSTH